MGCNDKTWHKNSENEVECGKDEVLQRLMVSVADVLNLVSSCPIYR